VIHPSVSGSCGLEKSSSACVDTGIRTDAFGTVPTHEAFGIQEANYDVVFTHLMDAIGAELPSDVWDFETRAGEIHDLFCLYRDFVLRCGYFFPMRVASVWFQNKHAKSASV
jgi:hypothetical protein